MKRALLLFLCFLLLTATVLPAGATDILIPIEEQKQIDRIALGENAQKLPVITIYYTDGTHKAVTVRYLEVRSTTADSGGCTLIAGGLAWTDDGIYELTVYFGNDGKIWVSIPDPYDEDWTPYYSQKTDGADWFRVWERVALGGAEIIATKHGRTKTYSGGTANVDDLIRIAIYQYMARQNLLPAEEYTVTGETACALVRDVFGVSVDLEASGVYDAQADQYTLQNCGALAGVPAEDAAIRYTDGQWMAEYTAADWTVSVTYGDDLHILSYQVTAEDAVLYGDVNGDGDINSLDGLILMRYLNGWELTVSNPEAMDVNADGNVNSLDGLILMRYLNGWDVTLGGELSVDISIPDNPEGEF